MTILRKSIIGILCVIVLVASACVLMGFTTESAYAIETRAFDVDDYTADDRLLKEDGTLSTKDIIDFSNEVKAAKVNTSFPELSQVIPLEYLESSVAEDIFQHYGKKISPCGLRP